jgi:formylglycine-generating enzyme required for sulfatase activity
MECDGEQACRNVLMAGACLEDVGAAGLERAAALEVIAALEAASRNRHLPPLTQREAGFCLGRLAGDNSAFLKQIRPDLDEWVEIPAGEFLYGEEKHPETIQIPFAIQKYPVTNLQFRRFVQDRGYEHQEFWSSEGWAWRTSTYITKADENYTNWLATRSPEKRSEPFYWHDRKWNNPLAPVVGVTWFEAEAYGNWLAKQISRLIRLPTEQEWERAARGTQGREFAWGDKFDRTRLNCAEFWAEKDELRYFAEWEKWYKGDSFETASTTCVGQFPEGNTPEGISELCGNVWEWTNSKIGQAQASHVYRGGSWYNYYGFARCVGRYWYMPDLFDNYVGFRLVSPAQ